MCEDPSPPDAADDPLIRHCRGLRGVTEDVKWHDNLVFSVAGKMFAVFQVPDLDRLSFKVEPLTFSTLVGQQGIDPAPYLARHHWVRVGDRRVMPPEVLADFLTESYRLVASRLPKKTRRALGLPDA